MEEKIQKNFQISIDKFLSIWYYIVKYMYLTLKYFLEVKATNYNFVNAKY